MARKLTAFIHLVDDKGLLRSFGPNDVVPEWAAVQITNPRAWVGGEESSAPQPKAASAPSGSPQGSEGSGAPDNTSGGGDDGSDEVSAKPPLTGRGSGLGPWRAYAESVGIDVPDGAKKDDVVGLVEAAGK